MNQPAPAVVADVTVEAEVNMKVELRSTIKVAAVIRKAKQFVKTWLSAVSDLWYANVNKRKQLA